MVKLAGSNKRFDLSGQWNSALEVVHAIMSEGNANGEFRLRRDGDNLEVVVKVPMTAAALGTQVTLDTLEAERDDLDAELSSVAVDIPAGTQSGTRVTIPGRGVPRLRKDGRGELGVTLLVQTPTRLDDEQRELLRQLAELRDESTPGVSMAKHGKGVLGWLKEAFS